MSHRAGRRFWRKFAELPPEIQKVARENYELLKELPESAFERAGMHTEAGRRTLRSLLEGYIDHAESHARQVQAIRAEYKKAKGKK